MNSKLKDKSPKRFSINERLISFRDAFSGIISLLRYEHNARIHLLILVLVVVAGFVLRISATEWISIIIVAGLVFASECFNTSIEYLSDIVSPERRKKIKRVKDLAAAGVLVSVISSIVVGLIVFLPKIIELIRK